MRDALINMVALMGLDLFLIVVVSFISITVMESKSLKDIIAIWRKIVNKGWNYIGNLMKIIYEDIKRNWIGIILLTLVSIGVAWLILSKGKEDLSSLLISILGTFIGVIIIFIILRPRVRIIKELDDLTIEGNKHLKVRVENLGIFPVNDVEVQLLYYWTSDEDGKEIYHTKQIELLRQGAPILHGVFPKGRDTTYGCVTELAIQKLQKERKVNVVTKEKKVINEYEGILCRVKATHAISGVTYVREHKFKKDVVDKFFEKNRKNCVENNYIELIQDDLFVAQKKIKDAQNIILNSINTRNEKCEKHVQMIDGLRIETESHAVYPKYTYSSDSYASVEEKIKWWQENHPHSCHSFEKIDSKEQFDEFYNELANRDDQFIFRGVCNANFKMFTSLQVAEIHQKIQLNGLNVDDFVEKEIQVMRKNREKYVTEGKISQKSEDIDMLYISFMQHFGLYTPFMDFSYNLDKALFFAFDGYEKNDADYVAIYWLEPNYRKPVAADRLLNPILRNVYNHPMGSPNEFLNIVTWYAQQIERAVDVVVDHNNNNPYDQLITDILHPHKFLSWKYDQNRGQGMCKLDLGYLPNYKYLSNEPTTFDKIYEEFEKLKQNNNRTQEEVNAYVHKLYDIIIRNVSISNINLKNQDGCFVLYNPHNDKLPMEEFWCKNVVYMNLPPLNCANIHKDLVKKCVEPLLKLKSIDRDFIYPQGGDKAKKDFKENDFSNCLIS